jgi:hypothetical protein
MAAIGLAMSNTSRDDESNVDRYQLPFVMAVLFGLLASLACAASAFLPENPGPNINYLFACAYAVIGLPFGVAFGYVLGKIWLRFSKSPSLNASVRIESEGPQLVDQICVICGKPIVSILEGEFCSDCRNPVHFKCADTQVQAIAESSAAATCCPRCGT